MIQSAMNRITRPLVAAVVLLGAVPAFAQHGILEGCAGSQRTALNPYGLRQRLLDNPLSFYNKLFDRALQIKAVQGSARVILHMPNGWGAEGMGYSCQSLEAMEPGRRATFLAFLSRCDAADITTGVYICSRVSDAGITNTNDLDALMPMSPFDYDNPVHLEAYVERIINPYAEAGVDEFWFDGSAHSDRKESFLKLAADLRARGLVPRMEGIPVIAADDPNDRQPDIDAVNAVGGAVAMDRFWYFKENRRDWDVSTLPSGPEFVCIISSHQTFDDSVPSDPDELSEYLRARIIHRFEQGLTVFYMAPPMHDQFLQVLSDNIEAEDSSGDFSNGAGELDESDVKDREELDRTAAEKQAAPPGLDDAGSVRVVDPAQANREVVPARTPVMVIFSPGRPERLVKWSTAQRKTVARRIASSALRTGKRFPDRLLTLRTKGAPLRFERLSKSQQRAVLAAVYRRAASTKWSSSQRRKAAERYESRIAALLADVIRITRAQRPNTTFSIYGLPVEPLGSNRSAARKTNDRYQRALKQLDAFMPSKSLILSLSSDTLKSTLRRSLPEAYRRRDDRPLIFRTNGSWNIAFIDQPVGGAVKSEVRAISTVITTGSD